MLDVISIYNDVAIDAVSKYENGDLSYAMFNRLSRRAELRLIDWLSGDVAGITPPEPWLTQKNKDYLSPFIVKHKANVSGGVIQKPSDYYKWDNYYRIGSKVGSSCEEDEDAQKDDSNTTITILDGHQFYNRVNTFISGDKPSLKNPICKILGNDIEHYPVDLGSVVLEYIRYPKFASINPKVDEAYNDEIPGTVENYEWQEWAREPLIFFIVNFFADHISSKSIKENNLITGKGARP